MVNYNDRERCPAGSTSRWVRTACMLLACLSALVLVILLVFVGLQVIAHDPIRVLSITAASFQILSTGPIVAHALLLRSKHGLPSVDTTHARLLAAALILPALVGSILTIITLGLASKHAMSHKTSSRDLAVQGTAYGLWLVNLATSIYVTWTFVCKIDSTCSRSTDATHSGDHIFAKAAESGYLSSYQLHSGRDATTEAIATVEQPKMVAQVTPDQNQYVVRQAKPNTDFESVGFDALDLRSPTSQTSLVHHGVTKTSTMNDKNRPALQRTSKRDLANVVGQSKPSVSPTLTSGIATAPQTTRPLTHERVMPIAQYARARADSTDSAQAHIHPLFRTDSPLPPPATSPGTIFTASIWAGQMVSDAEEARNLSRPGSRYGRPIDGEPMTGRGRMHNVGSTRKHVSGQLRSVRSETSVAQPRSLASNGDRPLRELDANALRFPAQVRRKRSMA